MEITANEAPVGAHQQGPPIPVDDSCPRPGEGVDRWRRAVLRTWETSRLLDQAEPLQICDVNLTPPHRSEKQIRQMFARQRLVVSESLEHEDVSFRQAVATCRNERALARLLHVWRLLQRGVASQDDAPGDDPSDEASDSTLRSSIAQSVASARCNRCRISASTLCRGWA